MCSVLIVSSQAFFKETCITVMCVLVIIATLELESAIITLVTPKVTLISLH